MTASGRDWSLGAHCLALCVAACSPSEPARPDGRASGVATPTVSAPALDPQARCDQLRAEFEASAARAGRIEGLVLLASEPPPRVAIQTGAEGGCGIDPTQPAWTETWVVDDQRLANVFVWLEDPPDSLRVLPPSPAPVELRQRGCVYRPHALALLVGQELRVFNDDSATHNVHVVPSKPGNPGSNRTQAAGASHLSMSFGTAEVAFPAICDLHPWMRAWIGVFDHRGFAVTGVDGRFSFAEMPPGEHRLSAWHEALGRAELSVRVAPDRGGHATFVLQRKPRR